MAPTAAAPRRRSRGELIALAVLLVGTAALYLIDLGASGYANSYYAAAVQAMTQSWEAFFFGSLDAGNVITVDKPPASLWAMAASARIFGFSSWSMLVPQALMGVGSVALLHAAVRRVSGEVPALLAGAVLALTPVAALMFRFNNPDALLVLLMVAAAYATVRAVERAGTRWLLLAGVFIGLAFLAKMAQGFIVLPALVAAYLVAAPTGCWRRIRQLLGAAAAVLVSAGWYVAIAELWPASSRPYIGGSTGNSVLELALGYNGLGRIFGRGTGSARGGATPGAGATGVDAAAAGPGGAAGMPVGGFPGGGPGGGGGFGGQAGLTRLFNTEIGGQISWLLPAALVLLIVGLWLTRRAPRTDRVRASLILWGGWTLVTALVFSLAQGTFHAYYTVALAPGMAALIGVGGHELWRRQAAWPARLAIVGVLAGTATWAWVLLGRSAEFLPWLRWVIVGAALVTCAAVLLRGGARRFTAAIALAAVLTGLAAPAAYAVQTAATAHTGSIPLAGPSTGSSPFGDRGGAGPGGPGAAETADPALVALLQSAGTKWSAATVSAMGGASLALASDTTVMSIGGFTGSDPAPTLDQFKAYVAAGEVRYFVEGGGGPGGRMSGGDRGTAAGGTAAGADQVGAGNRGPGGRSSEIGTWVQQTFSSTTVGGRTVYDLAQPRG
ncbi:MAG TPA: glycosyltransferase family 39 protein [Pseudonocardia sp.]|nr:glycosyltransferase family 39 protein [Pseudonocardia sp.]